MFERGTEKHVVEEEQTSLLLHQSALREHLERKGKKEGGGKRERSGRKERGEGGGYC